MLVYLRDGSAQTIVRAVADQTFYLTLSRYTDIGPTSPNAAPITPGAWQDSQWSASFEVISRTRPEKNKTKQNKNTQKARIKLRVCPPARGGRLNH